MARLPFSLMSLLAAVMVLLAFVPDVEGQAIQRPRPRIIRRNRIIKDDAEAAKTPAQIAEEAFIYGFPMVMNYGTMYEYFIDKDSLPVQMPVQSDLQHRRASTRRRTRRSSRPTATRLIRSSARTCVPSRSCCPCRRSRRGGTTRCSSLTCTRSTTVTSAAARQATAAGVYMIAGPNWKGETPDGVKKVFPLRDRFFPRGLSAPSCSTQAISTT